MDYRKTIEQAKHKLEPLKPDRFVKISERLDKCDLSLSSWESLIKNSCLQTWKGIVHLKGPTEIALYPMLLNELRPKTILEIGAFTGGCAVWLADLLDVLEIEGCIYSVDIDLSLLDEKAKTDSRIHFVEGDCNNIEVALTPDLLATLPHPWIVIEDAHVNTIGVVEYLHNNALQIGDYLIIDDTNKLEVEAWGSLGEESENRLETVEIAKQKIEEFKSWLMLHSDEYLIDTYYQDLYGYNGARSSNSILKRV